MYSSSSKDIQFCLFANKPNSIPSPISLVFLIMLCINSLFMVVFDPTIEMYSTNCLFLKKHSDFPGYEIYSPVPVQGKFI